MSELVGRVYLNTLSVDIAFQARRSKSTPRCTEIQWTRNASHRHRHEKALLSSTSADCAGLSFIKK